MCTFVASNSYCGIMALALTLAHTLLRKPLFVVSEALGCASWGGVEAASFSADYKPYATCCERSSERVRQVFFVYNHISSLLTLNNKQN